MQSFILLSKNCSIFSLREIKTWALNSSHSNLLFNLLLNIPNLSFSKLILNGYFCMRVGLNSEDLLPMNLLTEKKVSLGFTTCCLNALKPVSNLSFLFIEITEGSILFPSFIGIDIAFPFSIIEASVFVVPKSIPTIVLSPKLFLNFLDD